MNIAKIDQNFEIKKVGGFDCDEYDASCDPFTVYGGFSEKERKFEKMPLDFSRTISRGVFWGSGCCAGIRITFTTNSRKIGLHAVIRDKCVHYRMTFIGSSCFALTEDIDGKNRFIGNFVGDKTDGVNVCDGELNLEGEKLRNYVLHLPLYSGVESLELKFEKGSIVKEYKKFANKKHILYYGSSITQGGCASRADNSYQELISEWIGCDYTILGFSGNAKAEDPMIEYLKNFDCDIFVCDYDYNAPNADYLAATHEKLYKSFRKNEKHKDIPVVFLSKPDGLNDVEAERRFEIIRQTYENAKEKGENVYLIDGRTFYPEDIYEHCSVDGCHPTDLGFYFMAKTICKVIKSCM